ncbi:VapE domain-containing protein [Rhizobium sp. BK251]|uniref:VapE domain-containing protein n=1 Tax=Rhizobium sp. BK251 TaxID=2512125 RepID=UPI001052AA4D|nr:VapE domain-containing protein [Rhizobium sp. BK251]TCL74441.1 hypothetical protein EV286_1021 [Rhizobium sp. BK251]
MEAVWAILSEGPDGITIEPSRLCKYLTEIADRARFDLFYEQRVELVLEGRAEIARRGGDIDLALLDQMLAKVLRMKQTPVLSASSRMLWRDFLAYQFVPPTQNRAVKPQGMVILSGYGGVGKSLLIYVMANGDMDNTESRFGRDLCCAKFDFTKMDDRTRFYRVGSSALVAEVKEGLGFARDADDNKAEIDRGEFRFDPKFLNKQVTYFRRYMMVMTTEDFQPLNWKHAWRRWLVSNVNDSAVFETLRNKGKPELFKLNIKWLIENYAVLSAIAHDELEWKGSLRLSDEDLKAIKEDNDRHVAIETWEVQLLGDLKPVIKSGGWFHDTELAKWMTAHNRRPNNHQISETMRRFGFTRTGQKAHGYVDGRKVLHREWLGPELKEKDYRSAQQFYWDYGGLGYEAAFREGADVNHPGTTTPNGSAEAGNGSAAKDKPELLDGAVTGVMSPDKLH